MKRRKFLKATTTTILFSQLLACRSGAKFTPPVGTDYDMKLLRSNVGLFTEKGGTIGWMVDKAGIAVIDTQFPEQSNHLIKEISKLNKGRIDLLVNTHHHFDHTSGNPAFVDIVDTILAHENSMKNQRRAAEQYKRTEEQVYPTEVFTDSVSKRVGAEVITLRYFGRGHTSGDAITHFENANVVHMGDLVFNRRFPYIDTSAGASITSWVEVLDKTLATFDDDTIYIFGHSGQGYEVEGTGEDIRAFQNYLERLLVYGEDALKASIPLEELIKKTQYIPGAEEWTGDGIERSLKAVYAELAQE